MCCIAKVSETRKQYIQRTWRTMKSGGWRPPAPSRTPSPEPRPLPVPSTSSKSAAEANKKVRYAPPQPDYSKFILSFFSFVMSPTRFVATVMHPTNMKVCSLLDTDLQTLFTAEMKKVMMNAPQERPRGKRLTISMADYDRLAAKVNQVLWQHKRSYYIEYPGCGVESDRY